MDEGVIFVASMALLSLGLVWLQGWYPLAFRRLALSGLLAFVLLVEWGLLLHKSFVWAEYTPLQLALFYGSRPMVILFGLCSLILLTLFLVVTIHPLRRRFAPRRARLLCLCAFSLTPLQLSLFMDCFNWAFLHPVIIKGSFCLTAGPVVALLLLWNVGMEALVRHLGSYEQMRRRRG